MNKKIIIVTLGTVVITALITYLVVVNISKEQVNNVDKNNGQENVIKDNDKNDSNEFKDIDINSVLADDVFKFVPKHFIECNTTINNEYIIYTALYNLEEKKSKTVTMIDSYEGYVYDDVLKEAKRIFGSDTNIIKKDKYNIPISYDTKSNAFCILPFGFGGINNLQTIKSFKENKDKFVLTLYVVNIVYNMDDQTDLSLTTKDTFKLYKQNETDQAKIDNSMKKYKSNTTDIDASHIVSEYKDVLPLIEYELNKLDNGKYYVSNIKTIY